MVEIEVLLQGLRLGQVALLDLLDVALNLLVAGVDLILMLHPALALLLLLDLLEPLIDQAMKHVVVHLLDPLDLLRDDCRLALIGCLTLFHRP